MIEFRSFISFAFFIFIFILCIARETTDGIIRMKLFGKLLVSIYTILFCFFFIFTVIITIVQPKTTILSLTFLKKKKM